MRATLVDIYVVPIVALNLSPCLPTGLARSLFMYNVHVHGAHIPTPQKDNSVHVFMLGALWQTKLGAQFDQLSSGTNHIKRTKHNNMLHLLENRE